MKKNKNKNGNDIKKTKIKKKELNKHEKFIFCAADGDITQLKYFLLQSKKKVY